MALRSSDGPSLQEIIDSYNRELLRYQELSTTPDIFSRPAQSAAAAPAEVSRETSQESVFPQYQRQQPLPELEPELVYQLGQMPRPERENFEEEIGTAIDPGEQGRLEYEQGMRDLQQGLADLAQGEKDLRDGLEAYEQGIRERDNGFAQAVAAAAAAVAATPSPAFTPDAVSDRRSAQGTAPNGTTGARSTPPPAFTPDAVSDRRPAQNAAPNGGVGTRPTSFPEFPPDAVSDRKPAQKQNEAPLDGLGFGGLRVRATAARSALPVGGAYVQIIRRTNNGGDILMGTAVTDAQGLTPFLTLPVGTLSTSELSPPSALYLVSVSADGFVPLVNQPAQVFANIASTLPAVMIPLSDGDMP